MSIESFAVEVIEGRKKSLFVQGSFYILSLFFRLITTLRHFLYDFGVFRRYRSSSFIVSVGNIVAGGTGKTPFVRKLVEECIKNPGSIAIFSRGYRSKKKRGNLEVSKGQGPIVSSEQAGDEPFWLAEKTKASIFVGKDRVLSAHLAEKKNIRVAILEDGFQYRSLERNLDIVLLDALDLFGKGHFLPRGYLRDSPKRLKKADVVVVTHIQENVNKEDVLRQIREFTKAPVLGFRSSYGLDPEVKGALIGAFCGIAKPDLFYLALEDIGCSIVEKLTSLDHMMPSLEDLEHFALDCKSKGAKFLVCTEKDLVKFSNKKSLSLPVVVLKMDFECIWNEKFWKEMCESIKNRV